MMTKCPECELPVSDKAILCPHCGYPLDKTATRKISAKKHMRLPNGFGQITELKTRNLRKPFRAMVTTGKTETGRPICKLLKPEAYFKTYNEAYEALVKYHQSPYDLGPAITVREVYERWFKEHCEGNDKYRNISNPWRYCSALYDMPFAEVRVRHLKDCIENASANISGQIRPAAPTVKSRIKSLFNMLYDYAVEYEIVPNNLARTFTLSENIRKEMEENAKGHIPFTDDEMNILWGSASINEFAEIVLVQCYTGFRPQEMGLLRLENISTDDWTITGGMKTEAGKDRLVPIHPRIRPLVLKYQQQAADLGSEYLFNCAGTGKDAYDHFLSYGKYQTRFENLVAQLDLNPKHRPHDPRVQFVTMAKRYGVDEYAIKYIVGHAIRDITEKTYTHRDLSWLHDEIKKIE